MKEKNMIPPPASLFVIPLVGLLLCSCSRVPHSTLEANYPSQNQEEENSQNTDDNEPTIPVPENPTGPTPEDPATPTNPAQRTDACYPSDQCYEPELAEDFSHTDYNYPSPRLLSSLDPRQYRKPHAFLNIENIDPKDKLSQNFKISEFLQNRKGPYGILAPLLVNKIQSLRDMAHSAIHITSGYRSPGYNSRINGAAQFSRHMYGDAVDFTSQVLSLDELMQLCKQLNASFRQKYRSHVHCDWRKEELSSAFYPEVPQSKIKHLTYKEYLSLNSSIKITPLKHYRKKYKLTAQIIEQEDGGILSYRWTIINPSGSTYISQKMSFVYNFKEQGEYKIFLSIGESFELSKSLQL